MNRLRVVLTGWLIFVASAASADTFTGAIIWMEIWRNGNIAFTLSATVTTCNSQFILNQSSPGAKNQYAAALAAKTTGHPLRVVTTGCGPADGYGGNYNIVEYVYVDE